MEEANRVKPREDESINWLLGIEFGELSDLSKEILAIEIEQPLIKSSEIIRILGVDKERVYAARKDPKYIEVLAVIKAAKIEGYFDLQYKAFDCLYDLLESPNENIRLAAAKIISAPIIQSKIFREKVDIQLQAEKERIVSSRPDIIEVVLDDSIPVISDSTINDNGRVVRK